MSFPEPLVEIADFLRNNEELVDAIVSEGDPRSAAKASAPEVIKLLQRAPQGHERWRITAANTGHSHDFTLEDGNSKLYVDLKISSLEGQDNTDCKAGIFHALTGRPPEEAPTPYGKYFRALAEHACPNGADYYFLIVGKDKPPKAPERAFVCSLRTLRVVAPSADNLPFQCKWSKCREPRPRTYGRGKALLAGQLPRFV